MTFGEYVAGLNELLKNNPELATVDAIYAIDDEGNDYHEVHSTGTIARVVKYKHGIEVKDTECENANAVIIN
jgi:hypothetical protein